MRCANKQMNFPSRACLIDVIILRLRRGASAIKKASLEEAPAVSVSFDLWMSSGAQDISSVVAYVCDRQVRLKLFHLALVRMPGTNDQSVRNQLEKLLCESKIQNCCVGYVYDGGSNLKACQDAVKMLVSCEVLSLNVPLYKRCWAHLLSTALSKAIGSDAKHDTDLPLMPFKEVKKGL